MMQDVDDYPDKKIDRTRDDEEWEGSDKRKHRSSRSKKQSNGEEAEELDSSGRRRSCGDRSESRKRSGVSHRDDSDEDDYDARKELLSKQLKEKQEESTLEKLSIWYQDGELENKRDGGDKLGRHGRIDESERRIMTSRFSEHEGSHRRSRSKVERSHDKEIEKTSDRDSRYLDRKESSREKGHGSSKPVKSSRRKWDEPNTAGKVGERYVEKAAEASDLKIENVPERSIFAGKGSDVNSDKSLKSTTREGRSDAERSNSKGKPDALEVNRASPSILEDRSSKDNSKKQEHRRNSSGLDVSDSQERSFKIDENEDTWRRDKSVKEVVHTKELDRHHESELSGMDRERNNELKHKELDSLRDDRLKGRDDGWNDRNRDRSGSKENWKGRQSGSSDKESKIDIVYDRGREWDMSRHGRERADNERPHGRSGNRKDGSRGEAVKTSSNFGISNENYDVIEIQTKPLEYGRGEPGSNFARRTGGSQQSYTESAANDEEWGHSRENRSRRSENYESGPLGDDSREKYTDDGAREDGDFQGAKGGGLKGAFSNRSGGVQNSSSGSQPPYPNQEGGSFGRGLQQGAKGSRIGRGRGRPSGRDNQQVGIPLPIMGPPFGPLGIPLSGPMQPLTPSMSPAPGPPISPGVFIPPFSPPIVWPGARGFDMNMLAGPPSLSPVAPGPSGARFSPNMGNSSNTSMFFNHLGNGRGVPLSMPGNGFNAVGPIGRGTLPDKNLRGWAPPRSGGPPGKAPSRAEQNDYSQNFVDTGMRPQNFIRELELTNVVEDYPKLRELIQKKDEIVANSASAPMYYKADLHEFDLSSDFFGTKFDVILVDPPWEEYVHRAPGVADHMEYWTFEEILNIKIEAIADTPSFIFLWVGDGVGLEQGRQCLKKWGFRRCEDICWVKTNKSNATPGLRHDSHTLFQHSKEHCLMGIKGTVRRSTDGHIIHANIDTDVIIAEEPPYGSTQKPEDMYRIIEHFSLGRRRLELFGEDHNIRSGWLTVGKGLSSSNFNSESYLKNFADKDGKVWQGGGGRNPPSEAPHLVVTTPDIEALRPKSPMKNQQQMQQQQSNSISLTASSSIRRDPSSFSINQEASSSNPTNPGFWGMDSFRGQEFGSMSSDAKGFDTYFYSEQANIEYQDIESGRAMNLS